MKMIKQLILTLIILLHATSTLHAQSEVEQADSLRIKKVTDEEMPFQLTDNVKNFDGFLLDMSLIRQATTLPAPFLNKYTKWMIPETLPDYVSLFQLNPDISYTQGTVSFLTNIFENSVYGINTHGFNSAFNSTDNLQIGSFKLKNGMRLNTYGQYNKDGWRIPSHKSFPWQKNNFKGAFELKSANGDFGIRVEVQQGR